MADRTCNIVPFPVRKKFRSYEPSAKAVALAMKEALRLGEPIDEQTARRLLIELYIYGFEPE
ncbi:hypothetical protein SH668x_000054 [Planctomicrobium sp. SH668]|uniref:hypothetical protein n=1 Tax=Planctomicrobium sp. SH668 TaxID=3448126 RepID=UPI003F5B9F8F